MELDPEVDSAYPQRWLGRVTVRTTDGRVLEGRVDEPKGDPGNTLSRGELEAKALRLAAYSGAVDETEMRAIIDRIWRIADAEPVGWFLPERAGPEGGCQPV
jgi:2-methylcitrate dehydratase PrpD